MSDTRVLILAVTAVLALSFVVGCRPPSIGDIACPLDYEEPAPRISPEERATNSEFAEIDTLRTAMETFTWTRQN